MSLLQLLNLETGGSSETIGRIISTAPRRYKVYDIPKRGGGTRTIAHPAKELKLIQRVILREILDHIAVSPIATAYVKGRGIVENARRHRGQRWILKLDFQRFFPSLTPKDWDRVVRRTPELRVWAADREMLHRILFWGAGGRDPRCLSIGAPTSPSVSNLVCLKLDEWLVENATKRGLVVSRYADDITVSGANIRQLTSFEKALATRLERSTGLQLRLNDQKRGLYGPGERKLVTGLVLTPEGNISLGRARKRETSALIHQFTLGTLPAEQIYRAKGMLAFAYAAEPTFVESMTAKYGMNAIDTLKKADSPFDYLLIGDL